MKKLSRILAVLMVLALMLSASSAFAAYDATWAVPTNLSQIENLPELPEYPTMKVKTVKGITTLTLSAPLTWLNAIQNWNWMDIITWNEDKTVGTYSTAGLKSAVGTGTYMGHWQQTFEEDKDFAYRGVYAIDGAVSADYVAKKGNPDNYTGIDNGEYLADYGWFENPRVGCPDTWGFEHTDIYGTHSHLNSWVGGYFQEDYVVREKWDYNFDPNGVQLVWRTKESIGMYCGWYDMGFAYDGGLQDGSDIKYTASGKVASITVTKTGENYLANPDKAPVKSEVTYKWMYGRPYIAEIKETYDDDSSITAKFNFNGVLINHP